MTEWGVAVSMRATSGRHYDGLRGFAWRDRVRNRNKEWVMQTMELPKNVKIAVAVSGGADSVALLDKMFALRQKMGWMLSVVHCEHGIRGEDSRRDCAFVEELAKKYGLPFYPFSADCPLLAKEKKLSLEVAAREFRYECFNKLIDRGFAEYIALAHHLDDCAETTLFRLCRGTALRGVSGMSVRSGRFLRPLLDESKVEILDYLAERNMPFCMDATNLERCATRNVLRLDVMPVLEREIPGAARSIAQFARLAKEDDEYLYSLAGELVEQVEPRGADSGFRVRIAPPALFRRACLSVLERLGLERDYTAKHLEALDSLRNLQTGAKIVLPKGIVGVRRYEKIAFLVGEDERAEIPSIKFQIGEFVWGRYALKLSLQPPESGEFLRVDMDKIPEDTVIRGRLEGDTFQKFGGGQKSLKKYLIDRKIPAELRDGLPLLAAGKEIFAVFGVEISEKAKVTDETKNIAYLTATENSGI